MMKAREKVIGLKFQFCDLFSIWSLVSCVIAKMVHLLLTSSVFWPNYYLVQKWKYANFKIGKYAKMVSSPSRCPDLTVARLGNGIESPETCFPLFRIIITGPAVQNTNWTDWELKTIPCDANCNADKILKVFSKRYIKATTLDLSPWQFID